jgi:hypothetical protein
MSKQPEQIVEEQLVAKLQRFGYGFVVFILFKSLKTNIIKILTLKMFTEFKKGITFVITVLATLKSERAAYQGEAFAFIGFLKNINNTSYASSVCSESILRGSFFYSHF